MTSRWNSSNCRLKRRETKQSSILTKIPRACTSKTRACAHSARGRVIRGVITRARARDVRVDLNRRAFAVPVRRRARVNAFASHHASIAAIRAHTYVLNTRHRKISRIHGRVQPSHAVYDVKNTSYAVSLKEISRSLSRDVRVVQRAVGVAIVRGRV